MLHQKYIILPAVADAKKTINEIAHAFQLELQGIYSDTEISAFTRLVLGQFCGLQPHEFILKGKNEVDVGKCHEINNIIDKLKSHHPIQYLLGHCSCYGLYIEVNEAVLIPRPETEELIDWIVKSSPEKFQGDMLDIGCGSGCITLALKKAFPHSFVRGLDISTKALDVAESNARHNALDVEFIHVDILDEAQWGAAYYDLIVSNPPYILPGQQGQMGTNVLEYEPHLALFVEGDDPLQFYKPISLFAQSHLKDGGRVYLEVNESFAGEVVRLMENMGFTLELRQDLSGKDRMLCAYLR